jgi:xanthine dehydrogenase YagR molybdenum-binding subunit
MSGAIGQEVSRVDGPAKVTGAARYSGEIALPGWPTPRSSAPG